MQLSNQISIGDSARQNRGLTADLYLRSPPWRDVAAHRLYDSPQARDVESSDGEVHNEEGPWLGTRPRRGCGMGASVARRCARCG
jgi:hypothetical protein